MDVSVVVVNWRSQAFVRRCVASIRSDPEAQGCEIVVIDNASYDGCGGMLKQEFPEVAFIQSERNLGFGKACNEAAREASGRYLLFLNPDAEVTDGAIGEMYRQLRALPRAGAVGAKLLNGDGTIQTSCIQAFPTIANQVLDSHVLRKRLPRLALWGTAALMETERAAVEVEAISGACILVSRQIFEEVGGFSEEYFMYGEDVDLCFKMERAGYRRYYIPAARVTHIGGASTEGGLSDFSVVMIRESVWIFLRKTRGRAYAGLYRAAIALSALVRLVLLAPPLPRKLMRSDGPSRQGAFRKWKVVFAWSMGARSALEPSSGLGPARGE